MTGLPSRWLPFADRDDRWAAWVDAVPRIVADLTDEWQLVPHGEAMLGRTALVLPVVAAGRPAVLKVAGPCDEGRHEILALHHWHGHGAAALLRADPRRQAMLLERLHARDLTSVPDVEACEIVAGLYPQLHVAAPPQLTLLTTQVAARTDALAQLDRGAPVPHRIVEHAVQVARGLIGDSDSVGRLIHTDLHYANVLAADREPWLAIGPQPVSGDPHYEIAPLLASRWDEVVGTGDVRRAVRRRFHAVVDAAGLDEDRARDWVIVREAHQAMAAIGRGEHDRVTAAVAIIKAVQD
ncbi:MAG: aminoglycoside resistance protein [Aeromicrobium sp.]|nr:aminoglycoside resistance protein [Aeromicrobium sp.]